MVGKTAVAVLALASEEAEVDEVAEEEDKVAEDDAGTVTNADADDPDAAVVAPILCSARSTILVRRSFSASLARSDARSI